MRRYWIYEFIMYRFRQSSTSSTLPTTTTTITTTIITTTITTTPIRNRAHKLNFSEDMKCHVHTYIGTL
jgi:SET domain-containing protein